MSDYEDDFDTAFEKSKQPQNGKNQNANGWKGQQNFQVKPANQNMFQQQGQGKNQSLNNKNLTSVEVQKMTPLKSASQKILLSPNDKAILEQLGQENKALREQLMTVNAKIDKLITSAGKSQSMNGNEGQDPKLDKQLETIKTKLQQYEKLHSKLQKRVSIVGTAEILAELTEQIIQKQQLIQKLGGDIKDAKFKNRSHGKHLVSNSEGIESGSLGKEIEKMYLEIQQQIRKNCEISSKINRWREEEQTRQENQTKMEEIYQKLVENCEEFNIPIEVKGSEENQQDSQKLETQKQHLQKCLIDCQKNNQRNLKTLDKSLKDILTQKEDIIKKLEGLKEEHENLQKITKTVRKQKKKLQNQEINLSKSQMPSPKLGLENNKTYSGLEKVGQNGQIQQPQNQVFNQPQSVRSSLNSKPQLTKIKQNKQDNNDQKSNSNQIQPTSSFKEANSKESIQIIQKQGKEQNLKQNALDTKFQKGNLNFNSQQNIQQQVQQAPSKQITPNQPEKKEQQEKNQKNLKQKSEEPQQNTQNPQLYRKQSSKSRRSSKNSRKSSKSRRSSKSSKSSRSSRSSSN